MKNIIIIVGIIVVAGIVLIFLRPQSPSTMVTESQNKTYTLAIIATHNSETDCWMVVREKVYDVTSYISNHPNGDIIDGCGKEATTLFDEVNKHRGKATVMLDQFLIGTVRM